MGPLSRGLTHDKTEQVHSLQYFDTWPVRSTTTALVQPHDFLWL